MTWSQTNFTVKKIRIFILDTVVELNSTMPLAIVTVSIVMVHFSEYLFLRINPCWGTSVWPDVHG